MDVHAHNSVAIITWSPGTGYPRLTRSVMNELAALLTTILRERHFSGLVIAADSESFAIGADIEELVALDGMAAREFALAGQAVFQQIDRSPLPVVAAIRGFCLGGGLDLALACHGRVATYDSSFGHPGGALGLLTGWGGTQRLPCLIGKSHAMQMLLTGDRIPATQALTMGLVDELASSQDLIDIGVRHARELSGTGSHVSIQALALE